MPMSERLIDDKVLEDRSRSTLSSLAAGLHKSLLLSPNHDSESLARACSLSLLLHCLPAYSPTPPLLCVWELMSSM